MSNTRRRVKLYVLNEERQWDDHGTGHVSSMYVDHDKLRGIALLVRSEEDGSVLLESRIQTDTVYQKQQDTLIVWSEGESDLALSFQEKDGCDEIWEKICQVHGKDPSVDITQDVGEEGEEQFEEVQDYSAPIELPPCELSRLEEMAELFASSLTSPLRREKLATALEQESFVKKLLDLFHMCEDLENMEGLHHLYEIFKTIFMLNKNSLFEVMFTEESIFDVVGILEYDPSKKDTVKHRQFLKEKACFKEVIPISNKELLSKIHQTYRVQYIQDILVPVPSVFDENMSTLSSFIFFNKIEIVNMVQEDDRFLSELFLRLTDDEISDDKRRDLVLFLKELCNLSQTLQQQSRVMFLKSLSVHGLLQTLETLLNLDDEVMKAAIIDILCCVVEYIPSLVREYLVKEANRVDEDSLLINLLIDHMICGGDNSTAVTLLYLLRMLLDPENMGLGSNKMEKSEFLSFFYKHCMHVLTAPLLASTSGGDRPCKDDPKTAATLDHILDVLSFCVEHHTYHIKNYILSKDLLRRVLILMYSGHKYLALAALRFLRRIVGAKDEFYNRYIARGKLLDPVIKAFDYNGQKYNLLNSAVLELFEYIRVEDIKSLCSYIVENHQSIFEKVDYVETFKGLRIKYDQEKDRQSKSLADRNSNHGIIHVNSGRFRRDARDLEEDEEIWFDSEDDDLGTSTSPPPEQQQQQLLKSMNVKLKDVDLIDNLPIRRNTPSPPLNAASALVNSSHTTMKNNVHAEQPRPSPALSIVNSSVNSVNTRKLPIGGLVDYPDDDDDDVGSGSDEEMIVSPAKKPRLNNISEN